MKQSMRTFIAVDLPAGIKEDVAKILHPIRDTFPALRWIDDMQFHLTLRFLGEVPVAELHHLLRKVESVARSISSFDLTLEGIGVFPDWRAPRTVWVGISEGLEPLRKASLLLDDRLQELGFRREQRTFTPHLTVARIRSSQGDSTDFEQLRKLLEKEKDRYFGVVSVEEFVVYAGELSRNGPRYEPLAVIPLPSL